MSGGGPTFHSVVHLLQGCLARVSLLCPLWESLPPPSWFSLHPSRRRCLWSLPCEDFFSLTRCPSVSPLRPCPGFRHFRDPCDLSYSRHVHRPRPSVRRLLSFRWVVSSTPLLPFHVPSRCPSLLPIQHRVLLPPHARNHPCPLRPKRISPS